MSRLPDGARAYVDELDIPDDLLEFWDVSPLDIGTSRAHGDEAGPEEDTQADPKSWRVTDSSLITQASCFYAFHLVCSTYHIPETFRMSLPSSPH